MSRPRPVVRSRHTSHPWFNRADAAAPRGDIGFDELALAARNHGMPLEALR